MNGNVSNRDESSMFLKILMEYYRWYKSILDQLVIGVLKKIVNIIKWPTFFLATSFKLTWSAQAHNDMSSPFVLESRSVIWRSNGKYRLILCKFVPFIRDRCENESFTCNTYCNCFDCIKISTFSLRRRHFFDSILFSILRFFTHILKIINLSEPNFLALKWKYK